MVLLFLGYTVRIRCTFLRSTQAYKLRSKLPHPRPAFQGYTRIINVTSIHYIWRPGCDSCFSLLGKGKDTLIARFLDRLKLTSLQLALSHLSRFPRLRQHCQCHVKTLHQCTRVSSTVVGIQPTSTASSNVSVTYSGGQVLYF